MLRHLGGGIEALGLNGWQLRTLKAIGQCRTSALGGHVDACDACGNVTLSYNSCRNRHCPKCQGGKREEWIKARERELLPVPYFHVVFTLPGGLNGLALHRPVLVYNTLFAAAWNTLRSFGREKGLQLGMVSVLHTWGQNLSLHPHLHCIVVGGGVDRYGRWKNIRPDGKFLFPVKALSKVFRAKYCAALKVGAPHDYAGVQRDLWAKPWVVFAKRPFGDARQVVEYLGRYTHKVAIGNQRIVSVDDDSVSFWYKDYRQGGKRKQMSLSNAEFTRRFAMHILPRRFVKVRHFGILSSTWKRQKLGALLLGFGVVMPDKPAKGVYSPVCACCGEGKLVTIVVFDSRGPPSWCASFSDTNLSQGV